MTIRWGVSPIGWANDDMPSLGADTTLTTILSDARDIGFAGIELGHLFPRDPAALASVMAEYNLSVIGGWHDMSLLSHDANAEIAAITPHLDLLVAIGADVVVVAETSNAVYKHPTHPMTASPRLAPDAWRLFGQRLDQVAAAVADRGLRLAYHHHLGTVVETRDDLDHLLESTGAGVNLTLDTGHALHGGIDPVAVVNAWPERIAHVHAKDVRRHVYTAALLAGRSFLDGVRAGMFTTPGTGEYDYARLVTALRKENYNGWIVIEAEQDPARFDPRVYASIGLQTLVRLIGS